MRVSEVLKSNIDWLRKRVHAFHVPTKVEVVSGGRAHATQGKNEPGQYDRGHHSLTDT